MRYLINNSSSNILSNLKLPENNMIHQEGEELLHRRQKIGEETTKIRVIRINFQKRKPSPSRTYLLYTFIDQRSRLHRERLYADAMLHNTKASSVDSLSLSLPPFPSLCILSRPLQRLTSYFLINEQKSRGHHTSLLITS